MKRIVLLSLVLCASTVLAQQKPGVELRAGLEVGTATLRVNADPQSCPANTNCLAWDSSPSAGVTYNVYRGKTLDACGSLGSFTIPATGCTKVNSTPITGLTFNDSQAAGVFRYTVRAEIDGLLSLPSNELTVSLPPLPPANIRLVP